MNDHVVSLAHRALEVAKRYLRYGRDLEALEVLTKLVRVGTEDTVAAEQVQVLLAEIHLRRREYAQARRHLHVALAYRPDNAQYHFMMAVALEDDPEADPRRALYYFRKAARLDPTNPEYFAAWGSFLINQGRIRLGLRRLEKAVELAPEDAQYVQQLALGWVALRNFEKARRVALHGLFRNPDDSRLRRLWDEIRWHEARHRQHQERLNRFREPIVIPLPTRSDTPQRTNQTEGTTVRLDPPSCTPHPTPHRQKRQQES
ncbi:MAG: hypothetical protein NZM31_06355 [Gemmatales bacterium]|nr:hypothetical protein [Gemmatales bacterium]MDW8386621.1 hypothetical protein [Gemmatales bacterium]